MANLIKCPTPRNFRSGKISLSHHEAECVRDGHFDKIVILKYSDPSQTLFTKDITQRMIESIEDRGDFCLLSYK